MSKKLISRSCMSKGVAYNELPLKMLLTMSCLHVKSSCLQGVAYLSKGYTHKDINLYAKTPDID